MLLLREKNIIEIGNWGGLHLLIVQVLTLLGGVFIYVKIPEWDVNKSASRLYVYAPKVE